jgi:hypothetical protein
MPRTAALVLLLLLGFLAIGPVDPCGADEVDSCPPVCHLACADGCALTQAGPAAPQLAPLEACGLASTAYPPQPLDSVRPPDLLPPRTT